MLDRLTGARGTIVAAAFVLSVALLPPVVGAAEGKGAASEETSAEPPSEFETFTLVVLRRGPKWSPEVTEASRELQKRHRAHLRKMAATGRLVVAGPFSDQDDETSRGLCLYRAALAEARALAEADPAVAAGRLRVEAMTWWVEKGVLAFPKAPPVDPG